VARFPTTLRAKVLLLTPLLLAIPYVGYQYVKEMETFLREGLESSVLSEARALASALHDQSELFPNSSAVGTHDSTVYALPLRHAMHIDGYAEDWAEYRQSTKTFGVSRKQGAETARYIVGRHGAYLFMLLEITDDRLVYVLPTLEGIRASDQVEIATSSRTQPTRYILRTELPGPVMALETPAWTAEGDTARPEYRIQAHWRPTADGYVIEARLPIGMVGSVLGFTVVDVDDPQTRQVSAVQATFPSGGRPGELLLPSIEIQRLVANLGATPGRRTWVVDDQHRILARGGSLEWESRAEPINPLFALLLRPPPADLFSDEPMTSHLSGPELDSALVGTEKAHWRATANDELLVVSAAYPVRVNTQIAGAVVVEEASHRIQTAQRQALASLFNKTLLVCVVGALALFLFASRVSARVRKLRDAAEAAIDVDGRVTAALLGHHGHDEIGDLAGSFKDLLERLRQYNHYLERLAERLSHELRTPLAVVRSSMELGQINRRCEPDIYEVRARQGIDRLESIIKRMSEATRLEAALSQAERQPFDLDALARSAMGGYAQNWSAAHFCYTGPGHAVLVLGVPELIEQLLDKLVENALELGDQSETIELSLEVSEQNVVLSVTNSGSSLPESMRGRLFDSMVSVRERNDNTAPHLGLGLFIVRLIAEFHGGTTGIEQQPGRHTVRAYVSLPAVGR
jgi:dedicated sortase system histidine kinase